MATLQNIGKLKYRGKDGQWHPLPVVVQDADGGVSTISGKGAPTSATQGKVNQLYRNEDTQKLYICTATAGGYTWAAVVSDTEDAVTYTAQTLTEEQKTQARANIGAGTSNFSGLYNDLPDKPNIPAATVIDTTLTKSGQAADAKAAGDAIGRKIDAPQVAKVGEVLTVEEIGEDGKPKKWKTAAVDPKSIKDMYYEGFDAIDTWIHDPDNQHISENNITLSAGEQCTVRIGDDEYKVVAENKQTGRYDYSMVLGTWDFSSVPFYFTIASEYGAEVAFGKLYTRLSDSVTAGTKISLEKNFAHTIKEKYFPKTIFTQENAPVRFGDILKNSAVQGKETVASGQSSHAEGYQTAASGDNSHAEGNGTKASGFAAHAEGSNTVASNIYSHAEGIDTKATGPYSHAEGESTVASGTDQHVQGRRNIKDENDKYAHIVGNGISTEASNAYTLDWEGNAWFAGNVYVGSTSGTNKDDGSKKLLDTSDLLAFAEEVKDVTIKKPTTAQVGQIIKVKAVDADGKVTETEAVDMPTIPNDYELVFQETVAEDVGAYSRDTDKDGNPFSLTDVMVIIFTKPFAESTNSAGRALGFLPTSRWGHDTVSCDIGNSISSANTNSVGRYNVVFVKVVNGYQVVTRAYKSQNETNVFGVLMRQAAANNEMFGFHNDATKLMQIESPQGNITCVKIVGYTNPLVSAGTIVALYKKKGT